MSRIIYIPKKPRISYGALYNWWAATNEKNIAPPGWRVPTKADFLALMQFVDPDGDYMENTAGNELREEGTTHWNASNTNATNTTGFTALGAGVREDTEASFFGQLLMGHFWNLESSGVDGLESYLVSGDDVFCTSVGGNNWTIGKNYALSIRLIKEDGNDPGRMKDNDGNIYSTVLIGAQVWMKSNLRSTHFRDGTLIPTVNDEEDWIAGSGNPMMCYYENDITNA